MSCYNHFPKFSKIKISYLPFCWYKELYCALILREARTNEGLGFPQQDIFLEQVALCGMEGYIEFLQQNWTLAIINWKTAQGCYKHANTHKLSSRSANTISFGCSNHATGLAAAALSLNLRYVLFKMMRMS
ncbi:UPF0764 protein C16orf89 homolog [Photinus pyralis]|uniref:UPF0764 protein C16orf89 homolog n=1 Tax=Photinus pyralis TaxID=7054 RepID=UPI0012675D02|nr:UPF0764 protein C16orf89 homolog [Photinus pyralis]